MDWINSLASSHRSCGSEGSVGCVAILNRAAIGSNSAHGGFVVSISTTVHPRLLYKRRSKFAIKFLLNAFYKAVKYYIIRLLRVKFHNWTCAVPDIIPNLHWRQSKFTVKILLNALYKVGQVLHYSTKENFSFTTELVLHQISYHIYTRQIKFTIKILLKALQKVVQVVHHSIKENLVSQLKLCFTRHHTISTLETKQIHNQNSP